VLKILPVKMSDSDQFIPSRQDGKGWCGRSTKVAIGLVVVGTVTFASVSPQWRSNHSLIGDMFPQSKIAAPDSTGSGLFAVRIVNMYNDETDPHDPVPEPEVVTHILDMKGCVSRELPDAATELWTIKSAEDNSIPPKPTLTLRPLSDPDKCLKLPKGPRPDVAVVRPCDEGDGEPGQVSEVVVFDGLFLYNPRYPDDIICARKPEKGSKYLSLDQVYAGVKRGVKREKGKFPDVPRWCTWRLETVANPMDISGPMGNVLGASKTDCHADDGDDDDDDDDF